VAVALLGLVLVATALVVDPAAHASFEAPKRLVAVVGTALAAFAAFAFMRPSRSPADAWRSLPRTARVALVAAAAGLVWFTIASLLSPRRAASLDALRVVAVFALLLPLGASSAVARGAPVLAGAFLGATVLNGVISLLQSRGVQPFRLETFGTRNLTGALAGNVGYLALTAAFACVLALGIAISTGRPGVRIAAVLALVVSAAALATNRNLTAIVSVAVGVVALFVARFGRRSVLRIALAGAVLAAVVLAVPPLRRRATESLSAVRTGDWDRLTTYRTGAWAAALEMTRERPVIGWGAGTYAAEFVPHRLTAEIRYRHRYVNPLVTSSYSEAHCDYLQAFSEAGIPGGLAALVAAGALLAGLGRNARAGGPSRAEAAILFGLLVAAAAAALTWFPFQRPISAVPLLLAAGRGWRLAAAWPEP
jgi:O-antigen ligase